MVRGRTPGWSRHGGNEEYRAMTRRHKRHDCRLDRDAVLALEPRRVGLAQSVAQALTVIDWVGVVVLHIRVVTGVALTAAGRVLDADVVVAVQIYVLAVLLRLRGL